MNETRIVDVRDCGNDITRIKIHTGDQMQLLNLLADVGVLTFEDVTEEIIYDPKNYADN